MEELFIIKCQKCTWFKRSTGLTKDLTDLEEIRTCTKCGRPRKFRCPQCKRFAIMSRTK